jgi:hypothetical protein
MHLSRWIALSALAFFVMIAAPAVSLAQVDVVITVEPPELPVYDQPEIPAPGYIWAPGYWAYGPDGYFWVPGTWVEPPAVELLWTPGYWAFDDGRYYWREGYWGPHIGFYGGINYGFGYVGTGYYGGVWRGGVFVYNTTVTNIGSVRITNVYTENVVNRSVARTSFNGPGGVTTKPTEQELAAAHEHHIAPTGAQTQHLTAASTNKALLASVNHGKPAVAATGRPGQFSGSGVVAAREAGKFRAPTAPANTGKKATGSGGTEHREIKGAKGPPSPPKTGGGGTPPRTKSAKVTPSNPPKPAKSASKPSPRSTAARTPPKSHSPPPKKPKQ